MEPYALASYDFDLPTAQIAQHPAVPRDASRLLVQVRHGGAPQHRSFTDLPSLLRAGDVLVVNRTQVIPARLAWRRSAGAEGELLLERPLDGSLQTARVWEGIGRPGSALRVGRALLTRGGARLSVRARRGMLIEVRAEDGPLWPVLLAEGSLPLPPYIVAPPAVRAATDYQSIFAAELGAVAAPTASLHFTPAVLAALIDRGVEIHELVLHVGLGTFLPIRPEHAADVRQHTMHPEWYSIPPTTQAAVTAARLAGRRVVAVGTTCLRALESWGAGAGSVGETRLFIVPGHRFSQVDALVTNFHLPRSTLLLLVAAFAGRQVVMDAYRQAIASGYRLFSYGDAMLLV